MSKSKLETVIDHAFEEYLQSKGILINGDKEITVKIDFGSDFLYNEAYIFELIQYYVSKFAPNLLHQHLKIKSIELYSNELDIDTSVFNGLVQVWLHDFLAESYDKIGVFKGGLYDAT